MITCLDGSELPWGVHERQDQKPIGSWFGFGSTAWFISGKNYAESMTSRGRGTFYQTGHEHMYQYHSLDWEPRRLDGTSMLGRK